MNIGLIYGATYPPSIGGPIHGYYLVRGMVSRGHRIYSWYYDTGGDPDITAFRGRHWWRFLKQIDVLYVRIDWSFDNWPVMLLKFLALKRVPLIIELNGVPDDILLSGAGIDEVWQLHRKIRRTVGLADGVICVSNGVHKYALDYLRPRFATVVNMGSDLELFRPNVSEKLKPGPLRCAWIGSIGARWQDSDKLIAVAEFLENIGTEIVIEVYGSSDARRGSLPKSIQLCGTVPYAEMGRRLSGMHVGLSLLKIVGGPFDNGYKSCSPMKIFDYMASGMACVCADKEDAGSIVKNADAGITTDGSAQQIAQALADLSANRVRCLELGANGRRAAEALYGWDKMSEAVEQALCVMVRK